MDNGWIKIHRKFLDWEWFDTSEMVKLFLFFLLNANYEDKNWRGITVMRGQFVTSLESLKQKTGLSIQTIRTCINRLKSTNEITSKSTSKYTIITICKYDDYQQIESEANKQNNTQNNNQATNEQQTTNKQLTTTKEYKEIKNKRNNISSTKVDDSENKFSDADAEKKIDYKIIVDLFHKKCPSFPKVKKITESRKQKIKIRLSEMKNNTAVLETVFNTMENSKFLRGDNKNNWQATFDWVFENDKNWVKIIEGNYNDKIKTTGAQSSVNDIWK